MTDRSPTPDLPRLHFALVAVPLSRPDVSGFIRDWRVPARGAPIAVIEQRPPAAVRAGWLAELMALDDEPDVAVRTVLATDDAMAHVGFSRTDRLVPRDFLDDDDRFLERNLGGWAPLWFDAMGIAGDGHDDDPVLRAGETLVDYGDTIASALVDPVLVSGRLAQELPDGVATLRASAGALRAARADGRDSLIDDLVAAVRGDGPLGGSLHPMLAHDELIEQLYRLELSRRSAAAEDRVADERAARDLQRRHADELGVELLLKGEYIMGRHRRSTILLAEGLGVVVKQPAPEPEHEIDLGVRTHEGSPENWPRATGEGRMVTARADIAQVVGSTAVERLNAAFGRDVRFSTALGLTVEPFEQGPTLAELAVERPAELTADRYDQMLVHHLACEELGIDNPDWHAANFVVTGEGLVHVDWGAARPIRADERTPAAARERLDQVRELAWSFQDADLAERTSRLHERATSDDGHLDRLRARARDLVG
ncbi:MAG TPA: hypothetical protein VFZ70_03295 [Euzebyales bacterium]